MKGMIKVKKMTTKKTTVGKTYGGNKLAALNKALFKKQKKHHH